MENQNTQNSDDTKRKIKDLEREIIMLEDDRKKIMERKIQTEAAIRDLKKTEGRIKSSLQEKIEQLKKNDDEITRVEAEFQGLKKKMNLLR